MNWSRQFSRREKALILILALLLMFSVYYFFVLRPVNDGIYKAQQQIDALSTELDILDARSARYTAMTDELKALKASGEYAAVPDYDNLQQIMGFLNTVFSGSSSYQLNIQGIEQPQEGGDIVRRTMQMTFVSPSYAAARSAIEQLQGSPYSCQIGAVSINVDSPKDGSSLLSAAVRTSLTVTFYERLK